MRIKKSNNCVTLWLSENDTYDWAHRPNNKWPCSVLSGHRLRAEFDSDDLIDLTINGRLKDCPSDELNAITEDYLNTNGG